MRFDYDKAFSRTIGWLSHKELEKLRNSCIAIAGLGGVGGSHLLTLTRLGVGRFHLADFDRFEIHNFNRQAGADLNSVNRPKLDVMIEKALAINPELQIERFSEGVTPENLDQFLKNVDVYADGLDAFSLNIRSQLFQACEDFRIPVITAAPIGMGSSMVSFMPGGMSYRTYFGFDGHSEIENFHRLILGVSPSLMHLKYLDRNSVSAKEKRGPSTPIGCEIAAGMLATQVIKILLNRGKIYSAPWSLHFDAYRSKFKKTYMWSGHFNPLFNIKLWIMKWYIKAKENENSH